MKLNDQIISPRAFTLGGIFVILAILFAAGAFAAECPNHCSEERIDYYAAQGLYEAGAVIAPHVTDGMALTAVAVIRDHKYSCPTIYALSYERAGNGDLYIYVSCSGGALKYTIVDAPNGVLLGVGTISTAR